MSFPRIILTVADHEQDGFLALAHWPVTSMADGLAAIRAVDASISDEEAGDSKVDAFNFLLDLHSDAHNCDDTSEKCLPLQLAMRIAPDAVQNWLNTRPNPNKMPYADSWGVRLSDPLTTCTKEASNETA